MDMSTTISPKSTQLNADDLIAGPRNITITSVSANPGNAEQPVAISFEGDGGRPFLPCKTIRRVMVHCWGKDASAYIGRTMTLYRDPEVTWGGMKVGGIRISHMSHIDGSKTMALTATQKQRKPYTVKPLVDVPKPENEKPDAGILAEARAKAKNGTVVFRAWWSSNPEKRADAKTIMPELQKTAADADAMDAEETDPFGLPPMKEDGTGATPEEQAELDRIAEDMRRQMDENRNREVDQE